MRAPNGTPCCSDGINGANDLSSRITKKSSENRTFPRSPPSVRCLPYEPHLKEPIVAKRNDVIVCVCGRIEFVGDIPGDIVWNLDEKNGFCEQERRLRGP